MKWQLHKGLCAERSSEKDGGYVFIVFVEFCGICGRNLWNSHFLRGGSGGGFSVFSSPRVWLGYVNDSHLLPYTNVLFLKLLKYYISILCFTFTEFHVVVFFFVCVKETRKTACICPIVQTWENASIWWKIVHFVKAELQIRSLI